MALNQSTQLGLATASFGVLSFVLAILAELKKPPYGTAIRGRDVVVCRFPPDPTVALGAMSTLAAACTAAMGALAVFFPYGGRRVPRKALFAYTPLFVFFHVAIGTTVIDMEPLHRVSRSPPPAPPPPPPPPSTAPKSRPSQPSLEQIHPHTDTPPRSSPDPSLFWRESPPPPPSFRPLYLADEVEVVPESPETHSPRIPSFAEVVKRRPLKSCLRSASAPPAVLKTARRIRFAPSPSPTKAYGRRSPQTSSRTLPRPERVTTKGSQQDHGWIQVKTKHWWRKESSSWRRESKPATRRANSLRPADTNSQALARFRAATRGRCFRCLARDHRASSCRDPVRCLRCNRIGHRRRECRDRRPQATRCPAARSRPTPTLGDLIGPTSRTLSGRRLRGDMAWRANRRLPRGDPAREQGRRSGRDDRERDAAGRARERSFYKGTDRRLYRGDSARELGRRSDRDGRERDAAGRARERSFYKGTDRRRYKGDPARELGRRSVRDDRERNAAGRARERRAYKGASRGHDGRHRQPDYDAEDGDDYYRERFVHRGYGWRSRDYKPEQRERTHSPRRRHDSDYNGGRRHLLGSDREQEDLAAMKGATFQLLPATEQLMAYENEHLQQLLRIHAARLLEVVKELVNNQVQNSVDAALALAGSRVQRKDRAEVAWLRRTDEYLSKSCTLLDGLYLTDSPSSSGAEVLIGDEAWSCKTPVQTPAMATPSLVPVSQAFSSLWRSLDLQAAALPVGDVPLADSSPPQMNLQGLCDGITTSTDGTGQPAEERGGQLVGLGNSSGMDMSLDRAESLFASPPRALIPAPTTPVSAVGQQKAEHTRRTRKQRVINASPVRRSARLSNAPKMHAMEKAQRNLCRKLGLLHDDRNFHDALQAYVLMFDGPLPDHVIAALTEIFGFDDELAEEVDAALAALAGEGLTELQDDVAQEAT